MEPRPPFRYAKKDVIQHPGLAQCPKTPATISGLPSVSLTPFGKALEMPKTTDALIFK